MTEGRGWDNSNRRGKVKENIKIRVNDSNKDVELEVNNTRGTGQAKACLPGASSSVGAQETTAETR